MPATRPAGSKLSFIRRAPARPAAIPISTSSISDRPEKRDPKKREAILDKIQQLTIDRVMFAPVFDFRALNGIGPGIAKDTIGCLPRPVPQYEDFELKPT
jgi:hypothetical protein